MGRTRTIPDAEVFHVIRTLLRQGGDKAVAFSAVAQITGLAAPTLVQRYGSRDAMLRAALAATWDRLNEVLSDAAAAAGLSEKGAAQILKRLASADLDLADATLLAAGFRDPLLKARATTWRQAVEAALAERLGAGAKGRETATLVFAAWQGQVLWRATGGHAMRPKDLVKRLS